MEHSRQRSSTSKQEGPSRLAAGPAPSSLNGILGIQSAIGNLGMVRLLGKGLAQPKLPVASGLKTSENSPLELVRRAGGRVETGSQVDYELKQRHARAATLKNRVLLRSDLAAHPDSPSTWWTLAHEAAHVLQQRRANGSPIPAEEGNDSGLNAERDANQAARSLLAGQTPFVSYHESAPIMRFLLDDSEFDPPEGALTTVKATADPYWVEADIVDYSITTKAPYIYTALYADGNRLEIPLDKMFSEALEGATMTLYRRHKKTGRLVPFQIAQDTLTTLLEATKLTAKDLHKLVPVRFDTKLTPLILAQVNQAQMMDLAVGLLGIAVLWAGAGTMKAPIGTGASIGAKSLAARAAARRLGVPQAAEAAGAKAIAEGTAGKAMAEAAAAKVGTKAAAETTAGKMVAEAAAAKAGTKAAAEATTSKVIAEAGGAKAGTALAAAADITKVADELFVATASTTANGPRFIKAASILSSRTGLSALDKVKVIKEFAKKIGFGFGKQGLVDEGAHMLLFSEDSLYVFKFVKDSGQISYGKFDIALKDYIWIF